MSAVLGCVTSVDELMGSSDLETIDEATYSS